MEITANALQLVAENQNILFTDTAVCGSYAIFHRENSGLVSLRGLNNCQARARFKVIFNGNVAIPTGGTVGPITLAIANSGEAIATTTMISTPTAVEAFNNVSAHTYIDVPTGCCFEISVKNLTDEEIAVQNANLIIERVA